MLLLEKIEAIKECGNAETVVELTVQRYEELLACESAINAMVDNNLIYKRNEKSLG